MEQVIFSGKKAYYMVETPAGLKDQVGNKVKPVYHSFEPCSLGFAYATSDKHAIEWVRKQDLFAKGLIWELDAASAKAVQMGPQVVQGGAMSSSPESANVLKDEIEALKAQVRALLKKEPKAKKGKK